MCFNKRIRSHEFVLPMTIMCVPFDNDRHLVGNRPCITNKCVCVLMGGMNELLFGKEYYCRQPWQSLAAQGFKTFLCSFFVWMLFVYAVAFRLIEDEIVATFSVCQISIFFMTTNSWLQILLRENFQFFS